MCIRDSIKGRIYLEEAESIFKKYRLAPDTEYINLINSLAITYGNLGLTEKENDYFDKGVELAKYDKSLFSFNLINTYAIGLGKAGSTQKGEALLRQVMEKAKSLYGADSHYYAEMLNDYATYLLIYVNDPQNALKHYSVCIDYLNHNNGNKNLRNIVLPNYANALFKCGDAEGALLKLQEFLFNSDNTSSFKDPYQNPPADSLKADKAILHVLSIKYDILWNI